MLYEDEEYAGTDSNDEEFDLDEMLNDLQATIDTLNSKNVDNYEMGTNISSNLKGLFDKTHLKQKVSKASSPKGNQTTWKPPTKSGLDNSAPIFANKALNDRKVQVPSIAIGMAEPKQASYTGTDNEDINDDYEDDSDPGSEFAVSPRARSLDEVPMSAQLRALLNLPSMPVTPTRKVTWVPPSKPGLENSKPLIARSEIKPVSHYSIQVNRGQPIAYDIAEDENNNEDDDDEEDDDEDWYDNDNNDYQEGDLPKANMSYGLMLALGIVSAEEVKAANESSSWRPPSETGLKNSNAIVPNKHVSFDHPQPQMQQQRSQSEAKSSLPPLQRRPSNSGLSTSPRSPASSAQSPSNSSKSRRSSLVRSSSDNNNQAHSPKRNVQSFQQQKASSEVDEEEEEDWGDEEYDEEEGEEENDPDYDSPSFVPTGGMSYSLMKALGLDAPEVEITKTEWRPPQASGLTNSSPIRRYSNVALHK